ncbi:MAG: N-acetyltransferase family protein [Actinomycetota bacterium]
MPTVERIDWEDAPDALIVEATAFHNLMRAESHPGDPPLLASQQIAATRAVPEFTTLVGFAIRDGDQIVALARFWFEDAEDNQHLAEAQIWVLPSHRRRGYGTALLRAVVAESERVGRTTLMGDANDHVASGEAFAEAIGATRGLDEITNRLLLRYLDRDLIASWLAAGPTRAPGYSLVQHDGPYGDLARKVVPLHRLMNEAPRDDLDMEDVTVTLEHIQAWEVSFFARGSQRWSYFARHDETDRFVGFTELSWNHATPTTMWQQWTAVHPDHQGHALGKWLKAAMLDRVLRERPDVIDIRTANADSNEPMLAINQQLGFREYRSHTTWQVTLEDARAYLASRSSV